MQGDLTEVVRIKKLKRIQLHASITSKDVILSMAVENSIISLISPTKNSIIRNHITSKNLVTCMRKLILILT